MKNIQSFEQFLNEAKKCLIEFGDGVTDEYSIKLEGIIKKLNDLNLKADTGFFDVEDDDVVLYLYYNGKNTYEKMGDDQDKILFTSFSNGSCFKDVWNSDYYKYLLDKNIKEL